MKPKCSIFIATSLDGFIARPNGAIDWLTSPAYASDEDYGYKTFIDSVDALVMGRNSYETVLGFDAWPYTGTKVIVLSSGAPNVPEALSASVEVMGGAPADVLAQLAQRGMRHLYIDGGKTIQGFLNAGLIDEMTITSIPVLIGEGLPLFGKLTHDVHVQLIESKSYPIGFVQNKYRITSVQS